MAGNKNGNMLRRIGFSAKNMDLSQDPLDDFYLYACGNWLKKHEIPQDKVRIGSFDQLYDANLLILRDIAESCAKKRGKAGIEQKVGDLYNSFMDIASIESRKFKPLMPLLTRIRDIRDKDGLPGLLAELSKIGVSAFFSVYVAPDIKDSSTYSLFTQQGGISLPDRDYYIKEMFSNVRKEFVNHIGRMFRIYGAKGDTALENAKTIERIETAMAKASRSRVELRDDLKNYNRMTLEQVGRRYGGLALTEFYARLGVKDPKYVVIGQPEFLDKVNLLMKELDIDSIKVYMTWRVLNSYAMLLHRRVYNESFNFFGKLVLGQKTPTKRWKRAVRIVDALVGEALGKLYVKEHFDQNAKRKVDALVSNIQLSFRERMDNLDWMSPQTKRKAIEKLDSINKKVGYPKKFRDYSKVLIKKDDLIGNFQRAYAHEFRRDISRIGKKVDRNEWEMTPPTVNAYYNPSMNEIVLPAGIFQPPFFDPYMDDAVNYAGIGGVIGHEITHGFDDQGSRYDKHGNLKRWWSDTDTKKFKIKAERVAELYSSLEAMPNIKVNGKLTMGENIADLGGISIAYDALQKSLGDRKGKKLIEGFTQEQRFFLAWAQIWKGKARESAIKLLITTDPHSPQEIRGTIPAITHPTFESAFKDKSRLRKQKRNYRNVNLW